VTRRSARATAVVAAGVVIVLGLLAHAGALVRPDTAVSDALYAGDDRPGWLSTSLAVATSPGLSVFRELVYLPVLGWLAVRRAWPALAWVAVAVVLVSPLTSAVKALVDRPRPQFAGGGARLDSPGFPSGHSSGVVTLVAVGLVLAWPRLAPVARRWWTAAGLALVLVVGATRLVLGVHFPSDVLGGWCLGLAWTLAVVLASDALPGGRAALPPR